MSDAVECEVMEPGQLTPEERARAKEAIRLAYTTGQAKLIDLSDQHGISYNTAQRWAKDERWGESRSVVLTVSDRKTDSELAQWLTTERVRQVKEGVAEGRAIREDVRKAREASDLEEKVALAKVAQSLATAGERADLIIRRNLGMEDSGNTLNLSFTSVSDASPKLLPGVQPDEVEPFT